MENLFAFIPSLAIGAYAIHKERQRSASLAREYELMARAWASGYRVGAHVTAHNAACQAHTLANRIISLAFTPTEGEG